LGRDGYARVDGLGGSYGNESLTIGRRLGDGAIPEETTTKYEQPDACWIDDWRDFIESINGGRSPEVDASQGLAVMKLVDRIYSAAATRSSVSQMELSNP
jgi:predicted dehydrogenase